MFDMLTGPRVGDRADRPALHQARVVLSHFARHAERRFRISALAARPHSPGTSIRLVGPGSPLRRLYEWDGLTEFIRAALALPVLYRDADPAGACSIMLYGQGDELGWHFDNSEFAVTLMLRASEGGGSFEFVPRIRDTGDERRDAVGRLLAGAGDGIMTMDGQPGTLALFAGRHSIHRVTAIQGKTPRVNAVLAYAQEPGHRLTPLNRELFYGQSS